MAGDDSLAWGARTVRPRAPRLVNAAGAAVLLLTGCTSGDAPDGHSSPSPDPSTPATSAAPESQMPDPAGDVRFAYQPPDSPCPPVSTLETLPLSGGGPYVLTDPFFSNDDRFGYLLEICTYELAELKDVVGRDEDTVLTDHVQVEAHFRLYRDRETDSPNVDLYPALPPEPGELDQWDQAASWNRKRRVWWEECEPAPCAEGQEPTVRTYAFQRDFKGHVGNLEFDVTVAYIGETLPRGVEVTVVSVARDVVLAMVATKQRVDSASPTAPPS